MVKPQNRTIGVIAVLLMLGASPITVTYSFADNAGVYEPKESSKKEGLGVILTEKMVDGKLEVQRYALPSDTSKEDMHRMLSTEISGWTIMNYKAYNAGITLFDGKAIKVGQDLWEISTNGVLSLEEREFDLELSGKSNGSHVVMHGTASDEDLSYKVVFSGKFTENENVFEVLFNSATNPEMGQNIKFLQIGDTNFEKSVDSNQEFRNSISVR
ncbi:hypothetical protein NKOR_09745 [Candidatus Nitrosopumilus koreensis AR1]|uniref:Uncharacterized protein n=1 Tax=Candidatus Nitrosopumilus koreensis AR1 TaxID=1229908 RepID=K0B8F8_9ARCH|nr:MULTISPECIES: hypothetical protein [Nitrosopumilus]AFS81794.1 hypothetical protein NKOR_09745 [Candidatus Nitrosopumilus koreensis AR1]